MATPFQNLGTVVPKVTSSKRLKLRTPICLLYPSLHFSSNKDDTRRLQWQCGWRQPECFGPSFESLPRYVLCHFLNRPLLLFTVAHPFPRIRDFANSDKGWFKEARCEVLAVVLLEIRTFWDVLSCSLVRYPDNEGNTFPRNVGEQLQI